MPEAEQERLRKSAETKDRNKRARLQKAFQNEHPYHEIVRLMNVEHKTANQLLEYANRNLAEPGGHG